jgi:hypothetical protein
MFKQERTAVMAATDAAHRGIDTTLVISGCALVLAAVAVVIAVRGNHA